MRTSYEEIKAIFLFQLDQDERKDLFCLISEIFCEIFHHSPYSNRDAPVSLEKKDSHSLFFIAIPCTLLFNYLLFVWYIQAVIMSAIFTDDLLSSVEDPYFDYRKGNPLDVPLAPSDWIMKMAK
jgi:hypothetical protein